MRMDDYRDSDNVEDRRGARRGGGRRLGLGGTVIALVAAYFLGINPMTVLNLLDGGAMPGSAQGEATAPRPPAEDKTARFVSRVLASTEDSWTAIFQAAGQRYAPPRLVLFTDAVPTACGTGEAAMGPFYCPGDRKVYIDLSFFKELETRFEAPGEFAEAYVIAHEVGHHVQNLLGISERVQQARQRAGEAEANALSVRLELQADCLAGVWGYHAENLQQVLEPGDLEAALTAAAAIGDDRLQHEAQGRVVPESFTHGSSAQRVRWFRQGFEHGDMKRCDTFKTARW